MTETTTGSNRSAGTSYAELLDGDSHPVTEIFRAESRLGVRDGNTRIPAHMYHSRAVHDLEVERLWSRVWQLACHERDIPEVGDYHVYEIAHLSFLVVRTAPDEIKAYRNACLHRGRTLRENHGKCAKNLRCAFHGWAWNLDGSMKEIPCQWDFPSVDPDDYSLPEARVGTWHGFVFINPDRDAEPLREFLAGLDEHFAHFPFEKRFKACHVHKLMRVNWKACQEAFMESYHVVATHPTLLTNLGDANSRYDTFGNFSRAVSPNGVESPHLLNMAHWDRLADGRQFGKYRHPMSGYIYERVEKGTVKITDLDGNESRADDSGNWIEGPVTQPDPHLCKWIGGELGEGWDQIPLTDPQPPAELVTEPERRAWIADKKRADVRRGAPAVPVDEMSDAEMLDAIYYSVFPNWSPWGVLNPIMYRFRPHGENPDECIFEVMLWPPSPDPDNPPPPAPVRHLGFDDDWTLAPELGPLAKVYQQDSLNLPHVQTGMKSLELDEVVFANYGETKIRHFWEHLHRWLGIGETRVDLTPPAR